MMYWGSAGIARQYKCMCHTNS